MQAAASVSCAWTVPDPLPYRNGLAPLRIRLPHGESAATVLEFLAREYPDDQWAEAMAAGEVVDEKGRRWNDGSTYAPGRFVYFYREPVSETPVPFELEILYDDGGIVVVDKPHFLATIPRGMHVTETATVRLRRLLDCPELTPAHRLDRATAGVLIFTRTKELRRPYQELFSTRSVLKEYEAVAGFEISGAAYAVGHHWGTFRLTNEPIGEPHERLHAALDRHGISRERFRPLLPGEVFDVPPL